MRPLVATFIILASAGCATMDAAECRSANWQDVGYRDGLAGLQWTTDVVYDGQCAKHGVTLDALAYRTGWQDGKWEYEKRAIRDSTD
jgi:hypothetical protein